MLWFLFLFAITVLTGTGLSRWLWHRTVAQGDSSDEPLPFEKAASIAILGIAAVVALDWTLALTSQFKKIPLIFGLLLLGAVGTWALRLYRGPAGRTLDPGFSRRPGILPVLSVVLLLAPVAAWLGYILWRGWLLPVLSHDALAYHMPKAVLIAREAAYRYFNAPDIRIPTLASDYEMLLANVLVLDGADTVTEWVSTGSYAVFVIISAALAERWWGFGVHLLGVVLIQAGIPAVILHSGAHKNDLLEAAFLLGVILWGARSAIGRNPAPRLLALISLALAFGTKANALFVVPPLVAVVAWRLLRDWRKGNPLPIRAWAYGSVAAVSAFALLGGAAYAVNFAETGHPFGIPLESAEFRGGYGDWQNLWMFPVMLFLAPFSGQTMRVWNPWDDQYWLWPRYEVSTCNYGGAITVLLVLLPLAFWRYGGRRGDEPRWREREIGTALCFFTFLLTVPIRTAKPIGFFNGITRYVLFITAPIAAWTVAPVLRELLRRRWRLVAFGALLSISILFAANAFEYGTRDGFAPLGYVAWMMEHPGSRRIYFQPTRAANFVDEIAGEDDSIAIDGGFDTWSYPAFGAKLRRPVTFIDSRAPTIRIPYNVKWVVIDRAWTCIFGHPDYTNLSQSEHYTFMGRPKAEDLRVYKELLHDKQFKLVARSERINQAVFLRVGRPAGSAGPVDAFKPSSDSAEH